MGSTIMSSELYAFVVLTCILSMVAAIPGNQYIPSPQEPHNQLSVPKHLFVLGDSYSNIGFDPSGPLPTPGNPFGNFNLTVEVPEDSALARGPNWVVDLATVYNSTEILTYDLAVDCAVVNSSITLDDCAFATGYDVRWQSVQAERILKQNSYGYSAFDPADALFAYFIGINDASIPVVNNLTGLQDMFLAAVDELFSLHVNQIHERGVRNFVFLTVPPYDRTPQVQLKMNATYTQAQQHAIKAWNDILEHKYNVWTQQHISVQATLFDTTNVFNFVLDHPTQFGAKADGASCFGTLPDCLWADDFHPGPALHKGLARAIAGAVGGVCDDFFTS